MVKSRVLSLQKGFTVIELIVVILIIGILLTLGIGSWNSTQNRSKKESAVTTAEKVKLKLGTYFSEKDRYPASQGVLTAYIMSKGDSTLATDFSDTAKFVYASTTATGAACSDSGANKCEKYTITVKKSIWQGGSGDNDVTVTP